MPRSGRQLASAAALLGAALILWLTTREQSTPPASRPHPPAQATSPASSAPATRPPPDTDTPPAPRPLPTPDHPRSELADDLNAPGGSIEADLRIVHGLLGAFRSNFPRLGNPTGTNEEITAALAGANRLRLAVLPPDHPAINRDGQLCDRWGNPFFFHAESATRMTIRSAGPDGRRWTADDAVFEP